MPFYIRKAQEIKKKKIASPEKRGKKEEKKCDVRKKNGYFSFYSRHT